MKLEWERCQSKLKTKQLVDKLFSVNKKKFDKHHFKLHVMRFRTVDQTKHQLEAAVIILAALQENKNGIQFKK